MNFREEFNLSIRARCAVLYVTTREEERLLSVVKDCAAELENMRVVSWDFASGFDVGVAVGKGNPIAVLDFIAKEPADTPILYVLKDFHRFLEDNMVCRMVKNLAAQLKPQQKSILIVSPVYKVPEELTSSVSVLEFQLPTLPELREYITNITQNVVVDMDEEGFEQFVRAFQGLTISTVKTILSKALARSGKISLNDLQLVLEEKKQVIRKTQVLEFSMPKRPWAPSAAWMSSKAGSSPAAWPFRSRRSSSACPTPRACSSSVFRAPVNPFAPRPSVSSGTCRSCGWMSAG